VLLLIMMLVVVAAAMLALVFVVVVVGNVRGLVERARCCSGTCLGVSNGNCREKVVGSCIAVAAAVLVKTGKSVMLEFATNLLWYHDKAGMLAPVMH
jgi:hypothetical protein